MDQLFPQSEPITIPGLLYLPDYLNEAQENYLKTHVDRQLWLNDLKRRVQHYGYRYNYKAGRLTRKQIFSDCYRSGSYRSLRR